MSGKFQKQTVVILYSLAMAFFLLFEGAVIAAEEAVIEEPAVSPDSPPEEQKAIGLFFPMELKCTEGPYQDKVFFYRLYIPPELKKGGEYPLLLWFHGAGESGNDNRMQLKHIKTAIDGYRNGKGGFQGFVLLPQAPENAGWYSASEKDMLTVSWTMLERTLQDHPIDEDGISLAGVSAGGSACWEMGMRYPDRFCAIAPISSSGGDNLRIGNFVKTPMWVFNNTSDRAAPIFEVRKDVRAIQSTGGRALLTEFERSDHDSWTSAFGQYDLLTWLIARRRGDWLWWPEIGWPPELRTQWLIEHLKTVATITGLFGFVSLMLLVFRRETRRRKKLPPRKSN